MEEAKTYKPSVSQKQADMFHHAAHDAEYAESRKLSFDVAQGMHQANVAAGQWGKTDEGPCPKCNPNCEHPSGQRGPTGHCGACGLHESLMRGAGDAGSRVSDAQSSAALAVEGDLDGTGSRRES